MKQKISYLIIVILMLTTQVQSQNIEQRVQNSFQVIEGKVIKKESFWNEAMTDIFTSNLIEVYKIFKGTINTDTIEIITRGGITDDAFKIYSHHAEFEVGMEGIFFCKSSDRPNLIYVNQIALQVHDSKSGFIEFFNDPVNPPAADGIQNYKNIHQEIYSPILKESKSPITRISSNTKETSYLDWLNQQSIEIENNNSSTDVVITYSFENVQFTSISNIEFDIFAKVNETGNGFRLGEAGLFLKYNTVVFGNNVVNNNVLLATKGNIIQNSIYQLNSNDHSSNILKMNITGGCGLSTITNAFQLTTNGEQLCHLKLTIQDFSQLANLSFDDFQMNGRSRYINPETSTCQTFDKIIIDNPIKGFESDDPSSITYTFENAQVTSDGFDNFFEFDVYGKAENDGTLFSTGIIILDYSTDVFGFDIASQPGNLNVFKSPLLNDPNYFTFNANETNSKLGIALLSFENDPLSVLPTTPTSLVHVKMKIINCGLPAGIELKEVDMLFGSEHFVGGVIPFEIYNPTTARDILNSILCPPSNSPVIHDFYPPIVTAGTRTILTITGENFGSTPGNVMFPNADDGGMTFMEALPQDILPGEWTENKIKVYVPSNETGTKNPAGSGSFRIVTSGGLPAPSPTELDVRYAILNIRNSVMEPVRVEMINQNNPGGIGGYTFQRSENMNGTNAMNIESSINWALNQWNCETGVTWNLDATPSGFTNHDATDNTNLIYFAPDPQFEGSSVAFNVASGNRTLNCTNENLEVKQVTWFIDIDIAIKQSAPWHFMFDNDPGMNMNDFQSAILHEFGHAHRLKHAIPRDKIMYYKLDVNPPINSSTPLQINRELKQDDIDGGIDVLNSSIARIQGDNCLIAQNVKPISIHKTCGTFNTELIEDISYLNLFPNPTNSYLHLELDVIESVELSLHIFNLIGQSLYKQNLGVVTEGEHLFKIDSTLELPDGVYFLRLEGKNSSSILRFIKS